MPENFINKMAEFIADAMRNADYWYYVNKDAEMAVYYIEKVDTAKDICIQFDVDDEVWAEAKKIYDFTNSGREGYTLRDGKIVKVEED